ncbi:Uncharacterised protein [Serratia entomophila]|nr:Uncharacterised protein [Serratia entomophila]CAI1838429.1 Uncharacterised protein [Serratia entomophila]CAI2503311.1 Uncharacterised protein [Serratia entomophila]
MTCRKPVWPILFYYGNILLMVAINVNPLK